MSAGANESYRVVRSLFERSLLLPVFGRNILKSAGVALACVAVATLLRLAIDHLVRGRVPFLTYFPAVITAALLAGRWAGILAILGSAGMSIYWFEATGEWRIADPVVVTRLGLFVLVCGYIVFVCEWMLRARQREAQVKLELVQSEETMLRQQQEADERFRMAVDAARIGAWEWDILENQVTWNDRIYEIHQLKPGQFGGTVEDFANLVHPEDRARVHEAVQRSLRERVPYEIEFRSILPSGQVQWLTTHGRIICDADGTARRLVGVTLDITQRKLDDERRARLLEHERSAREEAERASRLKDEFLATVSHELRTPLNAILGWAQYLNRDEVAADEVRQGLDTIVRNSRLQAQLIEDLLDMSRIISGKLRLDVQHVDLSAVIEAALETVTPAAAAKSIRVERVLDPRAGPVRGDSARLQQVVWNLLSNAIKFTPKGGKVQVILARVNSHVEIRVADTGQGIGAEFLPYVFERFRQADGSTTRRHGGLGLGLSIVKSLVELHGGTVGCASEGEGHGATFTVSLPLAVTHARDEDAGREHPTAPAGRAYHADGITLAGIRALIVDDEPDALVLVKRVLERAGAEVVAAGSAAEAIAALEQGADVIISDIGMPELDGYEFLKRVRTVESERGTKTPAIALTAFARSTDRTRALLAGYLLHVAKPVEPSELVAAVASAVGRTG